MSSSTLAQRRGAELAERVAEVHPALALAAEAEPAAQPQRRLDALLAHAVLLRSRGASASALAEVRADAAVRRAGRRSGVSNSRPRMPSSSWPPIGRSCSAANQPGSGTDIELCVAGSTTSSSGRSHSSAWPLQRTTAGAGSLDAAAARRTRPARQPISSARDATGDRASRRSARPARAAGRSAGGRTSAAAAPRGPCRARRRRRASRRCAARRAAATISSAPAATSAAPRSDAQARRRAARSSTIAPRARAAAPRLDRPDQRRRRRGDDGAGSRRSASRRSAGRRGTRPTRRPPRARVRLVHAAEHDRARDDLRRHDERRPPRPARSPSRVAVRRRSAPSASAPAAASERQREPARTRATRTRSAQPREVAGRRRRCRGSSDVDALVRLQRRRRAPGRAGAARPPATMPTSTSVSVTVSSSRPEHRAVHVAHAAPEQARERLAADDARDRRGDDRPAGQQVGLRAQHELVGDALGERVAHRSGPAARPSRGRRTGRSRTAPATRRRRPPSRRAAPPRGRRARERARDAGHAGSNSSAVTTGRDAGAGWSWSEYGPVEQVPAVDERRRPAAVEVDRLRRPERDQQPRQLGQLEAGVDARAAAVAADGEQLVVADAERAARVARRR